MFKRFFGVGGNKIYPSQQKQQRKGKTKCIHNNNSFAAPWQYFNTMRLNVSHSVSRGKENDGKTRKDVTLFTLAQAYLCLLNWGTDLHWFCDKLIRLFFNWICAFAVLQVNCTRPWQHTTCYWNRTSMIRCCFCLILWASKSAALHKVIAPGRWQRTCFITDASLLWQHCKANIVPGGKWFGQKLMYGVWKTSLLVLAVGCCRW